MRIRKKTLIIIASTAISMTLLIAIFSQFIILQSFSSLEQQEVRLDVDRATNVLSGETSDLNNMVSNYVNYAEIYNFVQNLGQSQPSSVVDSGYANLRINLLLFINSSGALVSGVAYDLQNDSQVQLPQDLVNEILGSDALLQPATLGYSQSGVLSLPQGPVLIASRTILTETPEGPIHGALLAVRYLDSVEESYISQAIGLPVEVASYSDGNSPAGFQSAIASLNADPGDVVVQPLNSSTMGGYASINDIYGNPAVVIGVDAPRSIISQGQSAVNIFVIMIIGVSGISLIATVVLMERTVLSRLTGLTQDVKEIGKSGSRTRVNEAGNDELSELSVAINGMLSEIGEKNARLQKAERFAAIGELAAMVGHDLRNPLTGIKNAAYIIKKKLGPSMGDRERQVMALIDQDLEYSNKIITDLLDYSREMRLNLKETTPRALMEETLTLVTVPENVKVVDSTEDKPTFAVDSDKIKRTFINFIANAFDAMPGGGDLTISSKVVDGGLEMSFSDTGTGMTEEVLKKLWTPLFTTKAKGMGLGLPICKRIVEAHSGTISVDSKVGRGTTFTISLPLEPKQVGGDSK